MKVWRSNKNRIDCYSLFQEGTEFILFDTETTGLKADKKDRIIEIGALKFCAHNGKLEQIDEMDVLIRPPFALSDKIVEITHITNKMLLSAKTEEEVFPEIFTFFGESPVICAYNTKFDQTFMEKLYERNKRSFHPYLCADILEMARDLIPMGKLEDYHLSTIVSAYGLDHQIQFHRAIDDAKGTALLLQLFYKDYMEHPIVLKERICPTLTKCWYWEGYRKEQKAIYVRTSEGDILFNQYYRGWVSKEIDDLDAIDMEYVQSETLRRLHLISIDGLQKMTKKKMDEIRSFWYKTPARKVLKMSGIHS